MDSPSRPVFSEDVGAGEEQAEAEQQPRQVALPAAHGARLERAKATAEQRAARTASITAKGAGE